MKNLLKLSHWPVAGLLAGTLVLGSGCSTVRPVDYYQLQGSTVAAQVLHAETAVLLGPVKLADYLQREQIMQRNAEGRLSSGSARWAGSLEDEIGQLLLRQLAGQLGNSHVALYPDRIGIRAGAQVVLSISRLDSGVDQPAVLEAQWRLLDAAGEVRDSKVIRQEAAHSGDLASQVQAQSSLLVELAAELAAAIGHQQP